MIAYHFVGETLRDGSPVPPDGEWLIHSGPIEMCKSGLHASRHPFDALMYAPGSVLCLVECEGGIQEQNDKLVCARRQILRRVDTTALCRQFARQQALSVIHLWNPPQVVLDYLHGDESLRDAAWAAARDAALDAAAMVAAWAAAMAAARDAAWAAARDAARDAAWAAAWAAARDAARDAAWAAAWDAAWDAAKDAAKDAFKTQVDTALDRNLRG